MNNNVTTVMNVMKRDSILLIHRRTHLLSGKGCRYDGHVNWVEHYANAIKSCFLLLSFTLCLPIMAQRAPSPKQLTSFCGFKAGEKKRDIKVSKGNDIYPETVRCRSPFRKFRDARLNFSNDDRLIGVEAITFIQGMKPSGGKAELDKCCSELAKYSIVFPNEWNNQEAGHLEKIGNGLGISSVHIQGNLQASRYDEKSGREKKGVLLTINLNWDITPPIMPKFVQYSREGGLTRQKFVENTFGVTFGVDIANCLKLSDQDDVKLGVVHRRLATPICEMNSIDFNCDKGIVEGMVLRLYEAQVKDLNMAKQKFAKLCIAVKDWLGIDGFKEKNSFVNEKNQIMATFEDGVIRLCVCMITGKEGLSLSIEILPNNRDFSQQASADKKGLKVDDGDIIELRSGRVVFTGPKSLESVMRKAKEKYESILPFAQTIYGDTASSYKPYYARFEKRDGRNSYAKLGDGWTVYANADSNVLTDNSYLYDFICDAHSGPLLFMHGGIMNMYVANFLTEVAERKPNWARNAIAEDIKRFNASNRENNGNMKNMIPVYFEIYEELRRMNPNLLRDYFKEKKALFDAGMIEETGFSISDEAAIFSRILKKDIFHVFARKLGFRVSREDTKIPLSP